MCFWSIYILLNVGKISSDVNNSVGNVLNVTD